MAGVMSSAEMDVVDGDIVVVVGASGGVGRLVTQRYVNRYWLWLHSHLV